MADDRPIELVLVTGAGASVGLAHSGVTIAAMKDWAGELSRALQSRDFGMADLVGLEPTMEGIDFERRLGRFFASARAFRDAGELMTTTANFTAAMPPPFNTWTAPNIEEWHRQSMAKIDQVSEVVNETLYALFARPQFDPHRARRSYLELLNTLGIGPGGTNWVYATTNYDSVGDEALENDFRIDWGERPRRRTSEMIVDPDTLLDNVRTTVPILHLHGAIGWYRRSAEEGGQAIAVANDTYQPGFGVPIVMPPDPNKVYDSDDVIKSIWDQFNDALSRARRVLVLGHSLNDDQIVSAIEAKADPTSVGVTVYGHPSDTTKPFANNDPILAIRKDRLPQSTLIPIRFGEEGVPAPRELARWAETFR